MLQHRISTLAFFVTLLFTLDFRATALGGDASKTNPPRVQSRNHSIVFDANNISTYIRNNGSFDRNPSTGNAGFEWPKGSGKTSIYASGLWLGGKVNDTARVAIAEYSYEYDAGPLRAGVNPADARWRVYRIKRGDNAANNPDYASWPFRDGAPFVVSGTDTLPDLIGDMTAWTVFNDNTDSLHTNMNTKSLGIEVQLTAYAYNTTGTLGNTIFYRWKLINKGGRHIDSAHITIWSDPDLGDSGDDYVGCDSALALGYIYNADSYDAVYGSRPPAVGFAFLQGPLVQGTATDTARFPDGRILVGKKLLGMTSFRTYSSDASDQGNPQTGLDVFHYQQGRQRSGRPILDPWSRETKYMFSGDPSLQYAETNWIENRAGGDRRMLMTTGPFAMAPGDTQEVLAACIIVQGLERLSSVADLKNAARYLRQAHLIGASSIPSLETATTYPSSSTVRLKLTATAARTRSLSARLKRRDGSTVADAALFDDGNHDDGPANDGVFANSVTIAREPQGMRVDLTQTDSTSRVLVWERSRDHITTIGTVDVSGLTIFSDNLNNDGQANPGENVRYGFAVTNNTQVPLSGLSLLPDESVRQERIDIPLLSAGNSYSLSYDPNDTRTYFEIWPSMYLTSADSVFPVSVAISDTNDNRWEHTFRFPIVQLRSPVYSSPVTHTTGQSDWQFSIQVVDTFRLKDHSYAITIVDSIDQARHKGYTLQDVTDGRTPLRNQPFPDELGHTAPVVDGFKVLQGENFGMATIRCDSSRWVTPIPSGVWLQGNFFSFHPCYPTTADPIAPGFELQRYLALIQSSFDFLRMFPVEIRFDSTLKQKAYRLRRTTGIGSAYSIQATNPFVDVPLTAWDVSVIPPRQLTLAWRDQNDNSIWDPDVSSTEFVFIYSRSYNPSGHQWPYQYEGDSTVWANACTMGPNADIVYGLAVVVPSGHTLHERQITYRAVNWRSPSVGDMFTFNPYIGKPVVPIPSAYKLDQNYPNPFNAGTTIRFDLPKPEKVSLKIYNVLGQEVATILNEDMNAGFHTARWEGVNNSHLNVATGVYFYRLKTESFSSVKKMLVLR